MAEVVAAIESLAFAAVVDSQFVVPAAAAAVAETGTENAFDPSDSFAFRRQFPHPVFEQDAAVVEASSVAVGLACAAVAVPNRDCSYALAGVFVDLLVVPGNCFGYIKKLAL